MQHFYWRRFSVWDKWKPCSLETCRSYSFTPWHTKKGQKSQLKVLKFLRETRFAFQTWPGVPDDGHVYLRPLGLGKWHQQIYGTFSSMTEWMSLPMDHFCFALCGDVVALFPVPSVLLPWVLYYIYGQSRGEFMPKFPGQSMDTKSVWKWHCKLQAFSQNFTCKNVSNTKNKRARMERK